MERNGKADSGQPDARVALVAQTPVSHRFSATARQRDGTAARCHFSTVAPDVSVPLNAESTRCRSVSWVWKTENVQERTRHTARAIYEGRATSLNPAVVFMKSRHCRARAVQPERTQRIPERVVLQTPAALVCTFFAGRPGNFETVGS